LLVIPEYSRHPWRSRFAPPSAFAFAILQTQSRSDIRNPASFGFNNLHQGHWIPAFAGMTTMWFYQVSEVAIRKRNRFGMESTRTAIHG